MTREPARLYHDISSHPIYRPSLLFNPWNYAVRLDFAMLLAWEAWGCAVVREEGEGAGVGGFGGGCGWEGWDLR